MPVILPLDLPRKGNGDPADVPNCAFPDAPPHPATSIVHFSDRQRVQVACDEHNHGPAVERIREVTQVGVPT